MLFWDHAEHQRHELGFDATNLVQEGGRLRPLFWHKLIFVALQNFDTSMGPMFPVLRWCWRREPVNKPSFMEEEGSDTDVLEVFGLVYSFPLACFWFFGLVAWGTHRLPLIVNTIRLPNFRVCQANYNMVTTFMFYLIITANVFSFSVIGFHRVRDFWDFLTIWAAPNPPGCCISNVNIYILA